MKTSETERTAFYSLHELSSQYRYSTIFELRNVKKIKRRGNSIFPHLFLKKIAYYCFYYCCNVQKGYW